MQKQLIALGIEGSANKIGVGKILISSFSIYRYCQIRWYNSFQSKKDFYHPSRFNFPIILLIPIRHRLLTQGNCRPP